VVNELLDPRTRVHIVGVGGAGMSGLARLLVGAGVEVSGCDEHASSVLTSLGDEGVRVTLGHDASHVDEADIVTWSPAIDRGSTSGHHADDAIDGAGNPGTGSSGHRSNGHARQDDVNVDDGPRNGGRRTGLWSSVGRQRDRGGC
jgi:hypothetical protein